MTNAADTSAVVYLPSFKFALDRKHSLRGWCAGPNTFILAPVPNAPAVGTLAPVAPSNLVPIRLAAGSEIDDGLSLEPHEADVRQFSIQHCEAFVAGLRISQLQAVEYSIEDDIFLQLLCASSSFDGDGALHYMREACAVHRLSRKSRPTGHLVTPWIGRAAADLDKLLVQLPACAARSRVSCLLRRRCAQVVSLSNHECNDFLSYNAVSSFVLDVTLGLVLCGALSFASPQPVAMLEAVDRYIIRAGIDWLASMPMGLKLNRQLSEKIGHAGLAVLDLSGTLRRLVASDALLLAPIVVLAPFGASLAVAAALDLLSITTFHATVMTRQLAWLHRSLLSILASLWRLFRGRKWNLLRKRVDTASFDSAQLLLGTVLFTSLCFLLPTVVVYYALGLAVSCGLGAVRLLGDTVIAGLNSVSIVPLAPLFGLGRLAPAKGMRLRRVESDANEGNTQAGRPPGATRVYLWRLEPVPQTPWDGLVEMAKATLQPLASAGIGSLAWKAATGIHAFDADA